MRARATMAMNRRMTEIIPIELDLTSPLTLFVFTYARTGPKEASKDPCKQECTRPTNDTRKLDSVFPMGVLQHAAYQRRRPFSVSRTQARVSWPCVKVTFAGR